MKPTRKKLTGPRAGKRAERYFRKIIRKYAQSHAAPATDMKMFGEVLGYGRLCSTLLASDLNLRRKCAKYLGRALERMRKADPELKFQFWTFLHQRGHSSDRQPTIDLKFIRASVDKTLRKLGLDGIYVIEIQGLGNYSTHGEGRLVMTHAHALTWSHESLDLCSVEDRLNASDQWVNDLDAKPVKVDQVIDKEGELDYLSYYLFKPPYDVKMLETRSSGQRLKSTLKSYRPEFAARMLELQSQLEIGELVRACGEGKLVRREWWRRLSSWHRSREKWSGGKLPQYYFDDLWGRYRMKKKKKTYLPFTIIR